MDRQQRDRGRVRLAAGRLLATIWVAAERSDCDGVQEFTLDAWAQGTI